MIFFKKKLFIVSDLFYFDINFLFFMANHLVHFFRQMHPVVFKQSVLIIFDRSKLL